MPRPNFEIQLFETLDKKEIVSGKKKEESAKPDVSVRQLMRLETPPKIDNPVQVAKQFVIAERTPELRTILHSRIQNRLIRHRLSGATDLSARDVIREASTLLIGKNFSQEVNQMFIGVDSAIRSILADQQSFQKKHSENELQQIYFDDLLDAHYAIDYIDIRMEQKDDGSIEIKQIRFVQVKTRDISDDERSKILLNHKKYLAQLSSKNGVGRSERTRAIEHIRSGKLFEFESKDKTTKDIDSAERFFEDYFEVIDELVNSSDQIITEKRVQQWIKIHGYSRTDFFVFASLMSGEKLQNKMIEQLFDMFGLEQSKEAIIRKATNEWIEQVDPDSIQLSVLSASSTPNKKIISGADIVSVIHHGNQVEEIPLAIGSDKAVGLIPHIAS